MKRILILMAVAVCFITSFARGSGDATITETRDKDFKIRYMGNVEAGHKFMFDKTSDGSSWGVVTVTTTHGVMLKPYLFVGAGIGGWLEYYHSGAGLALQYYVDFRGILPLKGNFRPFIDLKAGGVGPIHSLITPTIGCKFLWNKQKPGGIYLSAGTDYFFGDGDDRWTGLSLNIGIDF